MTTTNVEGVQRYPENGIKVIIVGAGNGGLNAALECWRKGCDVVVLEKNDSLSPLGDFFTLPPSALVTLPQYPQLYKAYHEHVNNCSVHVYSPEGKPVRSTMPEGRREGVTHCAPDVDVSFLVRRPHLAKWQLEQCQALGIPVHFSTKGLNVEETADKVIVHTDKGSFAGDVCVAADGIGSKLPWPAPGGIATVQDSGYAVSRVAFPRTTLKQGSLARDLVDEALKHGPQFRTYLADDVHLILFITRDHVAWCFTHEADELSEESWHNLRDPEDIIRQIEKSSDKWDPAVIDFVQQTPTQVVDWRLMWRDGVEQWTSDGGRIIKLGDAAHSFFPTAGNGAVQAQEDGLSLAECLRLGGKSGVQWATKVHNKLRFQRVSVLQQTGFVNRDELHHSNLKAMAEGPADAHIGFFKIGRWVWDHNAEEYAKENFEACLEHVRDGKPFENTNLPPGHKYQPWSLESETKRMEAGERSTLKENGDWGY
ncbi:FAD-dependent monooxygenase fsr3 [Pseudocercospora fuligena]|uniref:FAD-dependent monooxygenase fsr3 n=1 Tax=Pseudocercospora fuligena TaxID=685502 RepID=A0A8H6RIL6_9PEZI|nr:FAD-dependent monooxygenase fsr3 [Pseudocercospora fuligena]